MGERPPSRKAIEAKCKDCMGHYEDGIGDCRRKECPLYYYMPYREREPNLDWMDYSTRGIGIKKKKAYTYEQLLAARERMKKARETRHA